MRVFKRFKIGNFLRVSLGLGKKVLRFFTKPRDYPPGMTNYPFWTIAIKYSISLI